MPHSFSATGSQRLLDVVKGTQSCFITGGLVFISVVFRSLGWRELLAPSALPEPLHCAQGDCKEQGHQESCQAGEEGGRCEADGAMYVALEVLEVKTGSVKVGQVIGGDDCNVSGQPRPARQVLLAQ